MYSALRMLQFYILPLRNARTAITSGPAMRISPTETSWKITSQLRLLKVSNIFSLVLLTFQNTVTSVAKLAINHIWLWAVTFNLLNKIIGK
ncbi:hypothetical protein BMF81_04297 [Nodularia spumigena UHCC 0039]|jgi:hypothetical protein|uniref:Uncharacterized protein n=1 Tax=Nodularia spumigena UHCC 0039 TaxID=1914872 RepID=A0A2S0Q579_NODSP|nr:hypothetical protein BMF81_04297 [Nodularia spumigena UHCC 0039]